MPIVDIYSKRQKRLLGEVPDDYVYDDLPDTLRVQIIHIWQKTLGNLHYKRGQCGELVYDSTVEFSYQFIVESLCHEYGVDRLAALYPELGRRNYQKELVTFFREEKNIDRALDAVDLSFRVIDRVARKFQRDDASKRVDEAIEELNYRFKEHVVGYQFTNGEIIRMDSEWIHSEVVEPALKLLNQHPYLGAQEEFLKAHEHYRNGNAKEALSEGLKAFESVMKAICDKRCWHYNENATATSLIDVCFDNELIPQFWQSHYSSLRSLLKGSVPTGRNKLGGHGQGTNPVTVPNHIVAYMLHMTASAIVFLAESEKQLP